MYANYSNCVTMNEEIYEMNRILNCGYEIKKSYDPRSYGHNFSNCVEKPARIIAVLDFISAVQFIDSFLTGKLEPTTDQLPTSVAS